MNPVDHPHGGGEGRAPIGRSGPVTPWGKPALGKKTRKKNKRSDSLIVRRRRRLSSGVGAVVMRRLRGLFGAVLVRGI